MTRALVPASVLVAALSAACGPNKPPVSAAEAAASLDVDDPTPVATTDDADTTDQADAPAATALPSKTACYYGELMVARAGETETNQGALLVKLTMDPSASRMVEETWSFPLYERYVVTRTIRGASFTLRQDDGAFVGNGTLEGQPWIWSGWKSTTTSADKATRVESATHFQDGDLVTHERVLDANGGLRVSVDQSLVEIPLDECDHMFAKARTTAESLAARRQTP